MLCKTRPWIFFSWEKPTICKSRYFLVNISKSFSVAMHEADMGKVSSAIMSPKNVSKGRSIWLWKVTTRYLLPQANNMNFEDIHRNHTFLGCSLETPSGKKNCDKLSILVILCKDSTSNYSRFPLAFHNCWKKL